MALQMIYVDDAAPGAAGNAGLTYNGTTTITSSKIIAGTAMTMSSTAAITGAVTCGATLAVTGNVAVNTNKFNVTASSGNTAIAGTLAVTGAQTLTGVTTHAAGVAFGGTENAAAHGAQVVPITAMYSGWTTDATSAIAATLADGAVGQLLMIKLTLKDTNNMVVTPANFNDGTTLTFDATGEYAMLMFIGTGWTMVAGTATVA